MRIAVLTTDTTHHTYFLWRLAERVDVAGCLLETDAPRPPFETAHPFEDERDAYEREVLLSGCDSAIEELAPALSVPSANDPTAVAWLRELEPELTLVFGTGILGPELLNAAPQALLNLHGGDPEHYRGLDTHLWAVYHRDFKGLVTTLHFVDSGLDTGDLVARADIPLERGMGLHQLRGRNTEICVELALEAAGSLRDGRLERRPQHTRGRYYSYMPAVLKDVCVANFKRHTATL